MTSKIFFHAPAVPALHPIETLCHSLRKAPAEERNAKIEEVASAMISLNPRGEIHWKTFAFAAAEFSSRFKSLTSGGLNLSSVCDIWLSILFSWQKNQGVFFKDKVKRGDLDRLIVHLKNVQTLEQTLTSPQISIERAASLLQKHLKAELTTEFTYMPLLYTGGKVQSGHGLIVKAEKMVEENTEKILLTFFNRGDGGELHPIVDLTPSGRIPSIRYFPIEVDPSVFFGKEGAIALSHLIRYMREPAPDASSPYEAKELYSILQTLGKPVPRFKNLEKKTYAKEPQITGNCAVLAVEHVLLDALVEMGYTDLEIEKIMLNMRLCFLIQAHLEFLKDPTHSYYAFVQESAAVLGVDLQSLKAHISQTEFIYTACTLIKISSASPPSPPSLELSPLQDSQPISTPPTTFIKKGDLYAKLVPDETTVLPPVKSLWPLPEFRAQNALAYFKQITATLKQLNDEDKKSYFEAVLTTLPIPQYGNKGVWDEIPEKEILPLLKTLKMFAEERYAEDRPSSDPMRSLVYFSVIYSIADSLVRRKVPQLESYASSFLPIDKKTISEPLLIIDGHLNWAYAQAYTYFNKQRMLKEGKKKEVIFPIEPTLPIEMEVHLLEDGRSITASHLRFLAQFIPSPTSNQRSLDAFQETWMGKGLPDEVKLLYHFSYLTHYGYRLKTEELGLPKDLTFEPTSEQGTRHLKISFPKGLHSQFSKDKDLNSKNFLFSEEIQRVDTNHAALARKEDFPEFNQSLSSIQISELLRIWNLSCPNLRFHQALQFMRNHKETVVVKNVQEVILLSVLAPRALFEAAHKTPDVVQTIRSSCYELIQSYANQGAQKETLFFLLDLMIALESQLYVAKAPPLSQELLRFYFQLVESKKKPEYDASSYVDYLEESRYLIHSLFLSLGLESKSLKEWASILQKGLQLEERKISPSVSCFWIQGLDHLSTSIIFSLKQIYREAAPHFFQTLPQSGVNSFCNQLVSEFLTSPVAENWQRENNCLTSSQFVLDVYSLSLQDHRRNVFRNNPAVQDHEVMKSEIIHSSAPGKWQPEEKAWISLDGKLIIRKPEDYCNLNYHITELKMQYRGEERWVKNTGGLLYSSEDAHAPLRFFFLDSTPRLDGWVFVNPRANDPSLLLCEYPKIEPRFALYMHPHVPNRYSIKEITREGLLTGRSLVNLGDIENLEGTFKKLACCVSPSDIFCLIDDKTGEIEEIKFAREAIHFKRNTDGDLECLAPHSGFYLDHNFHLEALGSFNGALVLKNAFGRRKVLMFPRRIHTGFGDQAHKITLGDPLLEYQHLSFELSPHSNDLFAPSAHAYLYLSYVMKAQKRYLEALRYLFKTQFSHKKQYGRWEDPTPILMNAFLGMQDGSLEAICINAHLSSRYFEYLRSMNELQFKEFNTRFDIKLIHQISGVYMEYLRVGGGSHALVPQEFFLSKEQEKTLLFFLEDYFSGEPNKFPSIFSDRLRLILDHETEGTIDDHPLPFSIINLEKIIKDPRSYPIQETVLKDHDPGTYPIDPYPVRISTPQLIANFFSLYSLVTGRDNLSFKYLLLALHHTIDKTALMNDRRLLLYILTKIFFCKAPMRVVVTDKDSPAEKSQVIRQLYEYAKDLPSPEFPKDQIFPIQRSFHLRSPFEEERKPVVLPSIEFKYKKTPLLPLAKQYLTQTPRGKKALTPLPQIQAASHLECSLDETLQHNQVESVDLPPTVTLGDLFELQQALLDQKKTNQNKIKKIKNEIDALFAPHLGLQTALFETEEEVQKALSDYLSRQRGTTAPFLPEKIMLEVILKGNPALLLQTFPLMTASHAAEIVQKVKRYFHLQAVDVLITSSLSTLEKVEEQPADEELLRTLYELLSFSFQYDPNHHPEISLFVTKTRLLPREQQIKIHLWLCEQMKKEGSLIFQGGAGLGKSSYLTPLLILRLINEECIPVVFTSQAMYAIDQENLGSRLALFGIKLDVLEVGMHTQLSLKKLRLIYRNLLVCLRERRPLIMLPQTLYALKLMYQHALKTFEEKNQTIDNWRVLQKLEPEIVQLQKESQKVKECLASITEDHLSENEREQCIKRLMNSYESFSKLFLKSYKHLWATVQLISSKLETLTPNLLQQLKTAHSSLNISSPDASNKDPIQLIKLQLENSNSLKKSFDILSEILLPSPLDSLDSPERIEYLSKICAFIKEHCRLVGDESHLVFDANTTAIFGFGKLIEESPKVYELYLQLLYPLLGIETLKINEGETAHDLFLDCQQMSGNEESGSDPSSKIHAIKIALGKKIIPRILPKLSKQAEASYEAFVCDPRCSAPASFPDLPKETKDQIGYLRFFLTTLLSPLTQMKLGRDHNSSPYSKQDFHTPCHKGVATTTQFLEALQTIVVTIKGVFESGLTEEQVIAHLFSLSLKASTYNRVNQVDSTHSLSGAENSFAKCAKNTPFEGRTLESLNLKNPEEKKALVKHFAHNRAMISDILRTTILPQIKFPNFQMELTPADLANMGRVIAFSATPGPLQALPTQFKKALYDHQATSQVVGRMLEPDNLTQIRAPSFDPKTFFTYLKEKKVNTFRDSRALIDLGGAFAHLPNEKIASCWLEASTLDGVLFFKKNKSSSINRDERITLLLRDGTLITFEGSHLQEAMNQTEYNYKTMKLGIYYDVSHTESADVPLLGHLPSFNTLFIPGSDDRFTYSASVQAVMRIRDFLNPDKRRKLIWIFSKGAPTKTREELYQEMVKNEAKSVRSRILHAAAQEISVVIRADLEAQLSPETGAEEQIQLLKDHEAAFISLRQTDPSTTYCAREETLAVDIILNNFASSYYNKCYGHAEIPKTMQKKIQELIQRASSIVKTASSKALDHTGREVEVEIETTQESKAHRPKPDDPTRAAPVYGEVSIKKPEFIEKTAHYLSTDIFGPSFSRFYFTNTQIQTATFYDAQMGEKKLKPIDFFIILFDKEGKVHIRATINECVNAYVRELKETEELPFMGHRALIMTGDGHIVQEGCGLMKPNEEEKARFLQSKQCQDLILDRDLLQARLPKDLKGAIRRMQEWGPSFREFYSKVVEAHPHKEDIETEAFNKVMDLAFGPSEPPQESLATLSKMKEMLNSMTDLITTQSKRSLEMDQLFRELQSSQEPTKKPKTNRREPVASEKKDQGKHK